MDGKELMDQFVKFINNRYEDDKISDEEKKKAAYALNMCTVSVSQIVDYDDINVLEQEYETILNNLNLEHMPKDDALRNIIRQLMDTITYFRIQEGDKEQIEKEYQQKMKNAIWSAVPNFGLIVAGGNLLTMGISLASQVGIGYMNYRRNKNSYLSEKDSKMWQLQRAAIEQFNGLRRELFDTAWRLADKYDFPDEYRLTEKQISQYNDILIDSDEIRKYERLDSIKDKFEAYPPFWYFFGNAANYIANNNKFSEEVRNAYRPKAIKYFEKYEELCKNNILREDSLAASCALEHADILIRENKDDNKDKISNLIENAVKFSGNDNDIKELCVIAYLEIGDQKKAGQLLRILVNEGYNSTINAQILSSIYVHYMDKINYELLASRVDPAYLYPMPEDGESKESVEEHFGSRLKDILNRKYSLALKGCIDKYTIEWNKITSVFNTDEEYPDAFFLDTQNGKSRRNRAALSLFQTSGVQKQNYLLRMKNTTLELDMLNILNDMFKALFGLDVFSDVSLQDNVVDIVSTNIQNDRDIVNKVKESMTSGEFDINAYRTIQEISLGRLVGTSKEVMLNKAREEVKKSDINHLSVMEAKLTEFCNEHDINLPDIMLRDEGYLDDAFEKTSRLFEPDLFGHKAVIDQKNADRVEKMAEFIKKQMNEISVAEPGKVYYKSDSGFLGYFDNVAFEKHPDVLSHALMILSGAFHTKIVQKNVDLVFTTDGIIDVVNDSVKYLTPYEEVRIGGNGKIILYGVSPVADKVEYISTVVDVQKLNEMIRSIKGGYIKNVDSIIEPIDGMLTIDELTGWFRVHKDSMKEGVVKIICYPTAERINGLSLGFKINEDLDPEHYILQYYYDSQNGDLLGYRVVNFDSIGTNLQAKLEEDNGSIKIK